MKKHTPFTEAQELAIVSRYGTAERAGETIRQIGKDLHCTDAPIRAVLVTHGVKLRDAHGRTGSGSKDLCDVPAKTFPALDWRLTKQERAERQRGGVPKVGR